MKGFWIRSISVIAIIGILLGYNLVLENREKEDQIAKLTAQMEAMSAMEVSTNKVSAQTYKDGIYEGSADGFGDKVYVQVEIVENTIKNIEIVSAEGEDGAYLSMAEDIISDIITAQSTDVDTISGATFSSTGIRDAVAQALEKAVE